MAGKFGATGEFPRGKLNEHDEGQIQMGFAMDPVKKVLIFNFGTPVAWFAMPKKEALELAEIIKKRAEEIPD